MDVAEVKSVLVAVRSRTEMEKVEVMLICPQCQFENPNTNKFCQRCGTSLTNKVCQECGTPVALNAKQCLSCGANTGTVWWAIIFREQNEITAPIPEASTANPDSGEEHPSATPSAVETQAELGEAVPSDLIAAATETVEPQFLLAGSYLDQEQRYLLLEDIPPLAEMSAAEAQVRVLDCQPFQLSPLAALINSGQDWEPTVSGDDRAKLPNTAIDNKQITVYAIPQIAKTYLALQSQLNETVPAIHDIWQQNGIVVVLLEDRSEWPKLIDLWHDDQMTSLKMLHWLYEMIQLWAKLEPYRCRQSLLEMSNLRVDEDQALSLQRLYAETGLLTLQDLGQVWQNLFHESQRTQFGSLVQMLEELHAGKIQKIEDLRSRLEEVSKELQVAAPPAEETPPAQTQFTTPTNLQDDETDDTVAQTKDDMQTVVLPMQLVSLEDAGRTDVGRQRHHNEDYFGIETTIKKLEYPKGRAVQARGLYILCDGMGGHAGGEIASNLAVKTIRQYFQNHWNDQLPSEDSIRRAVYLANQAIYDLNQQDARSGVGRMGTTLVMVLLQDTEVAVAHVGDSRLYRIGRKRGLEQISIDHEVGQREIGRGVDPAIAYARPDAYQLTQALGPRDENYINPDVQFLELNEDTLLILASDGLSDNELLEHHWHTHLEPLLSSRTSLERGVSDLIELANQYNGHDNITAVVIRAKVRPNLDQK